MDNFTIIDNFEGSLSGSMSGSFCGTFNGSFTGTLTTFNKQMYVEEVAKLQDTRLRLYYSEQLVASGTWQINKIESTQY